MAFVGLHYGGEPLLSSENSQCLRPFTATASNVDANGNEEALFLSFYVLRVYFLKNNF